MQQVVVEDKTKPKLQVSKLKTIDISAKMRLIPLGGLGEIGKNLMVYEYQGKILIVDCGVMFPEKDMLGIDLVIPNIKYLEERREQIVGMIFTHGHEDHIGGVPYIWPKLRCPLYATKLTAGLISVKMEEFGQSAKINLISPGDILKLGPFKIEPLRITHSVPDALGLAISTDLGTILHITDFKFDETPFIGQKTDFETLKKYGQKGVLALLSDSTNIEEEGHTPSDSTVYEGLEKIFKKASGRIIITSFASRIDRIQMVLNLAEKYHRKVAVSGRSLERNINITADLGFIKLPQNVLVDIRQVNNLPDSEIVIMATGSQGEEHSALVRMASGEHRQVKIKKGDTVAISAKPIPGNEGSIHDVVDDLYREGAEVIYGRNIDIHTSGHAYQGELKELIEMTKPQYFIPIHGEYRFLVKHTELAQSLGLPKENTLVVENGQVVEFEKGKAYISNSRVPSGIVLVDGLGVGDVGNIVLRDRQAMAADGIFVVILTVDSRSGQIVTSPDIISRGFVYMRAAEDLIFKARAEVKRMFARHNQKYPMNWDYIKKMMREEMGEFLYHETQRRPMVIPVIIEV